MIEYRLVVAGCRDFNNYCKLATEINKHLKSLNSDYSIIIVSGGASGADALGERYANEHKLKIERYSAEWEKYGRGAGPRRNAQMAQVADEVMVFWDGQSRGTRNMIECAQKANKPCIIINI